VRADVGVSVKKLPLEVAEVDDVVVDDRQGADAGRGQCHDDGEPSPPAPTTATCAAASRR
jgi:hypothetical protein